MLTGTTFKVMGLRYLFRNHLITQNNACFLKQKRIEVCLKKFANISSMKYMKGDGVALVFYVLWYLLYQLTKRVIPSSMDVDGL
jgi:hypothetical protein